MRKTLIFGMTALFCLGISYGDQQPLSIISIKRNIKPVGQVYIAKEEANVKSSTVQQEAANQAQASTGDNQAKAKQIYGQYCSVCHKSGTAGAPKFGDKADWQPRIKQGIKVLVQHAIHGYKVMPPKGTCMKCSDQDIQATVEYMVEQSK